MATGAFAFGRTYVDPPAITPTGRGLLHIADVRDVAEGSPEMRGWTFDSDSGEVVVNDVAFSGGIYSTTAMTDDADESNLYSSDDPFTIYGSYAGVMPIRDVEEANARAKGRLEIGEGLAVERHFWADTLAKHAAGNLLRSGTAVSPKLGLGLLAEWSGSHYAGVPLFHAGLRGVNELAAQQLAVLPDDGALPASTKGGGVLVPGAGYTAQPTINTKADGSGTAITPSADQVWLFASGVPVLYRDPITEAAAPKWSINQVRAFAQRTYTPGVDGPVAAVLITLT
jgi:hypothetical protein